MAKDETYVFEDDSQKKQGKLAEFAHFLWNPRTKEFIGRDGPSWAKVSLFYAIFYLVLGSFFVGMIAVFMQIMPYDKPTYFGKDSVMASRGVNPGLGFRPQVDVEDSLVKYTPSVSDGEAYGYKKYINNLNNFLNAKYPKQDDIKGANVIDCSSGSTYVEDLKNGKVCRFDHQKIFANTKCNAAGKFGFETNKACFLIKLNKIVSWLPETGNSSDITIQCGGEFSADKDNVQKVTYYSESGQGDTSVTSEKEGTISSKYFPYYAQPGYLAPFVWVQFDISPNTLVNIDCKAYAANIDNSDRMNRRGQTKFTLYVKSENKSNKK